ncbi:OLC1v1023355C1 [Oldenlandia corymbosa var. corymbosa]|uniref:OLC1v1023355C1 n=1 Tax=Oldenlandia corymbosa var. corymbosa TaxID=529605 RepID=A0AAV1BZR7_OLDCO|nr:OLC1v1023355C1 [Oldenlandia corymbosa var. corymbosa]
MGGSNVVEMQDYGFLKDLRVELKIPDKEENGSFCLCFWLYLTKTGSFSRTILHQEHTDITSSIPFLALNEKKEFLLFPVLHLHREASTFANSNMLQAVPCLSSSVDVPIGKWFHVGCQGSQSFLRLHINGKIVGEKSLTAFHNNELHADVAERNLLPCIVGDNHGFQGYVYRAELSSSTLPVKTHYHESAPLCLAIDISSASDIDDEIDGVWNIVGGKASCRRNFSLDVVLLDAFDQPVKKELEVVASLRYADNDAPVQETIDGEAPLLTSCDGTEYSVSDRPIKLISGRASFRLKIAQLSSKCDNKMFHIRFEVPKNGNYPFLVAFSLPIRCISRSRHPRTSSATWKKLPAGTYLCNGAQSAKLDSGSSETLHNVVCEAKPSPSSKRVKLGQDDPFHMYTDSLTSNGADGHKFDTLNSKKVGSVDGSTAERHENHDRLDNFSSESDNSETTRSDICIMPSSTSQISDEVVFKYCLAGPSERALLLKEIAVSVGEEELSKFADQVSLFSGCSHHLRQIKIAKRLIEEGIEAWNLISLNNQHVLWENMVTGVNEHFRRIACASRSLTQQDLDLLRRISGCEGFVSQVNFEKMWFWLYPVAFTLSQDWINRVWSSVSPKWIEGFLTKEEAESSLLCPGGLQDPGTFVLRFPTTRTWPHPDAGNLVITYVGSDYKIHHKLLSLEYVFGKKTGKSLQDLLFEEPELSRLGRQDIYLIASGLCYRRWKRKQMLVQDSFSGGKLVLFRSPKMKALKGSIFLKKTMKLSNKDIIGSGGYGTVYKLTINESTSFAVKRLNRVSAEQDRGFERELEAMGDIKHRNIVTLHGYYTAPHYNLLIYELMPAGSLDELLHGKSSNKMVLDWPSRYKIAVGAARGLAYLHHDCIPHIIHRDIKTSNILLDQNLEARISDFGLATLMEPNKTHVSTLVAGTFGYLAPEYFDTGRATIKGDVYSFGVVLLELLTGKKPTNETFIEEGTKLVTWVKTVVQEKREGYVIDSRLEDFHGDEINQVFNIALMCLEPEPAQRPTMSEVVKMLELIKSYEFQPEL